MNQWATAELFRPTLLLMGKPADAGTHSPAPKCEEGTGAAIKKTNNSVYISFKGRYYFIEKSKTAEKRD